MLKIAMRLATVFVLSLVALDLSASSAPCEVKPGDTITQANAPAVQSLVSPGTYYAVTRGMRMHIVSPTRIEWPPPYKDATEKYSGQVRLAADHRTIEGYVAGQPFPLLDANDSDMATKIMWNAAFHPIVTDDGDLRYFECQVVNFNPGAAQTVLLDAMIGHAASYSEVGRTEVEPLPADPDFKTTGVWQRAAAYPLIQPAEDRGTGGLRFRYWDPMRADDAWVYLPAVRRVRRVNEVIMSSSPGLSTWDADHSGGFQAKLQEYNFKFVGEREMLSVANAANSPAHPCPSDGGATACDDNWEMRHLYIVEATPRPERITGVLHSRTVIYLDGEAWFNPYVDSYDRKGQLWKTQVYLLTYRDRPVPDAKVAVYPFKREFVVAASSIDVQSGMVTTCYLPSPNSPERECWYINMGAVDREFFTTEAMARAGH